MTKSNLLIITDTYVGWPGGSERHLYNFLSNVDCTKFNIHTVQMSYLPLPNASDEVFKINDCVNLIHEPIQKLLSVPTLKLLLKLRKLIINNKISLIISYHEKSDVLNYLLGKLSSTNLVHISSKRDMGFKQSKRLKSIIDYVTPRLKNVTAPSQSIVDQILNLYDKSNISAHYIANGVDLDKFKPCDIQQKHKIRNQLGLDSNEYILGIVGSLTNIKGHKYLIDAFIDFSLSCKSKWKLIIIGDGPLKDSLVNQYVKNSKIKNIDFVGVQQNIAEWLQAIDLLISTSYSEGLSNALIEGAASGLPIIATDVGGNPEIVKSNVNGLLIKPRDISGIIQSLNRFDSEPELFTLYGNNSRELAKNTYSINVMVNQLEKLYIDLSGVT